MFRRFLMLLLLLPLIACAQVLGDDYETLGEGSRRWAPAQPGKVEVVELFAYTCGHCADFHPLIDAWKKKAPKHVRFSYVPATFDMENAYARAYFAAEKAGVLDRVHGPLFKAIHEDGTVPKHNATVDELATFFATLGLDRAKMAALMRSPEVDASMERAREFAVANKLGVTPSVLVDGRYLLNGNSKEDRMRILDELVARLAVPKKAPAAAPATAP